MPLAAIGFVIGRTTSRSDMYESAIFVFDGFGNEGVEVLAALRNLGLKTAQGCRWKFDARNSCLTSIAAIHLAC